MEELSKKIIVFIIVIGLYHLSISSPLRATEKQVKIVVVKSKDLPQYNKSYHGFVEVLKESLVNFQIKVYNLDEKAHSLTEIVAEISHNKPDLILTIGTKASQEITHSITDIPIIFSMVLKPEAQGLKHSTTHPMRNCSGIALDIPLETQFKLYKQSISSLKKVAVLYHPIQDSIFIANAIQTAKKIGIELIARKIKSEEDIPTALRDILSRSDVLWLIPNPYVVNYSSLKYILMFCTSNKIPTIGLSEYHVKAGALLAVRADYHDVGKQSGDLALRVLRKGQVNDQVILRPRKTKLFMNKRTAEMLKVDIPKFIIEQADQIYE